MSNYELPTGTHSITLAQAIEMTARYRTEKQGLLADPSNQTVLPLSETFNKTAFERLMNVTGATAIRIYYGMKENKEIHSIFVAVDKAGNDILPSSTNSLVEGEGEILEDGQRCPYTCPDPSPLNG
jgi:hypothetical protein